MRTHPAFPLVMTSADDQDKAQDTYLRYLETMRNEKELREHIATLVRQFGCTVKVPLFDAIPVDADAMGALDKIWNALGIRVRLEFYPVTRSFADSVRRMRQKAGLAPHPTLKPFAIFEPEDES